MKHLVYTLLFCSCALQAQEQKYILLDSITAHYKVKQYTLDTSPLGMKNKVEMYNVFSKHYGSDYLILISVLPDFNSNSNWEKIDFKSVQEKSFLIKNLFKGIDAKTYSLEVSKKEDINNFVVNLVKKENNNYYVSKHCLVEAFYCKDFPYQMLIATGNYVINTQQPITPISVLRSAYKEIFPNTSFPLDWNEYPPSGVATHQQQIYLSNIEKKADDTIYCFYQFANLIDRGIFQFAYIKNKGIVAGSYDDYFFPKGKVGVLGNKSKLKRLPEGELLWAEELKKEWEKP